MEIFVTEQLKLASNVQRIDLISQIQLNLYYSVYLWQYFYGLKLSSVGYKDISIDINHSMGILFENHWARYCIIYFPVYITPPQNK